MQHQFFPNELSGKFYLSEPKSKKPTSILFIVNLNKKQIKFHLGVKVYPKHWCTEVQRAYTSKIIPSSDNRNNEIANNRITDIFNRFILFKEYICKIDNENNLEIETILKKYINMGRPKKNENTGIKDIITQIKKDVFNATTIGNATIKNYCDKGVPALSFYLKYLEEEEKKNVNTYSQFTTEFFTAFSLYLLNNYFQPNGEPYTISTINSIIKYAKSAVILSARKQQALTENDISTIKTKQFDDKSSDNHIALRNDEVMKLYNYKCKNEKDEIIKDLFILECTLGCRVSDLLEIDNKIEEINGDFFITFAPRKTPNKKMEIKLIFEIARHLIIDKYKCKLPKCSKDTINKNIKRIAKEAGIKGEELQSIHYAGDSKPTELKKQRYELIATHTGRRSFITMLSAREWTYEQIRKYTGQTIEMVQHYDKATPKYKQIFQNSYKNNLDEIVLLHDEVVSNKNKDIAFKKEQANNPDSTYIGTIVELASSNGKLQHKIELTTKDLKKANEDIKNKDSLLLKAEEYIELLGSEDAIKQAIVDNSETDLVNGYVMAADGTIYYNPLIEGLK